MTWASTDQSGFAKSPVAAAAHQVDRLVNTVARSVGADRPVPAWAVVSAALSPVLLTGTWLIADVLQPASYSPIRQTVSVMAGRAGTDRWLMTAALFAVGIGYLVTAVGLTVVRPPARLLLAVAGLATIGIAASPEPVHGSTPQHLAWTALGAVAISIWPASVALGATSRTAILTLRGALMATVVSIALFSWLIIETQGGSDLGLAERLSSSLQASWPFVVVLFLRRTADASTGVPRLRNPRVITADSEREGAPSGLAWVANHLE